jgi:hypothetical protein
MLDGGVNGFYVHRPKPEYFKCQRFSFSVLTELPLQMSMVVPKRHDFVTVNAPTAAVSSSTPVICAGNTISPRWWRRERMLDGY